MKLIELLVQETLNGKFKWPSNASQIFQDYDGELRPDAEMSGLYLEPVAENHRICGVPFDDLDESYIVTREQYEAALAAAQQPVWSGEGLPPVDLLCEWRDGFNKWTEAYLRAKINTEWGEILVVEPRGFGLEWVGMCAKFRPIRSEANKKRDEVIEGFAYYVGKEGASDFYEAIAAGQVKGVKLDV